VGSIVRPLPKGVDEVALLGQYISKTVPIRRVVTVNHCGRGGVDG